MKKFYLTILVVLGVVLGLSWRESAQVNAATIKKGSNSDTLIVYFSKSGINYEGYRKTGNTAKLANDIQKATGADMYEIVPAKPYSRTSYKAVEKRATAEQKQNARPATKGSMPNVSKYKTIFIGSPIWYNEYPMPVRTFMDKVDLNGKTLIPFATDSGSGMGEQPQQLKKQYPKAKIRKGFSVEGADVSKANTQTNVNKWVKNLGLSK